MAPTPSDSGSATRFAIRAAVWIVGLVAALRLPWVEGRLLVPFAALQQRAAETVTGVSGTVVVDASCTGSEAMALTLGAVLAFPAPLRSRLLGCLAGLGLLTVANTARIGTLGTVARNRPLFDLLHVYVWPAALMLLAAGFVFVWMRRQEEPAPTTLPGGVAGRWLAASTLAVVLYYLAAPFLAKSALVLRIAGACAAATAALAGGLGLEAQVQGNYFFAASGRWVVTQACVLTPLIALYIAAAVTLPATRARRWAALAATAPLFFALAVTRLLVLSLPPSLSPAPGVAMHAFYQVVLAGALIWGASRFAQPPSAVSRGTQAVGLAVLGAVAGAAIAAAARELAGALTSPTPSHLGHGYADAQGALSILPAFQIALWVGLWWALSKPGGWGGLARGGLALAVLQGFLAIGLGELHGHFGLELPIVVIRALALAAPALVAWLMARRPGEGERTPVGRLSVPAS